MPKLTDVAVQRLKAKGKKPRIVYDSVATGLGLKATTAGRKIWILQLVYPGQKAQSRRTLGQYPGLSLADARAKAAAWYQLVKRGIDPEEHEAEEARKLEAARRAEALKNASTFAAFAERFIKERASNRRAAADAREIRRTLIAAWGDRPLHSITPRDVRELISALKTRTPYEAKNSWTHAVGIFKAAVHEELIEASPCASLDRRLLFKGAKIGPRQRVLNDEEVFALWRAAGRVGRAYGDFYRLLLLTGLRVNELGRARWSELHPSLRRLIRDAAREGRRVDWSSIDGKRKLLTISRERFKSDAEHPVPLSDNACAILEALPRFAGCDFLFTTAGTVPINGFSKGKKALDARMLRTLKALARQRGENPEAVALPRWVLHDLRRVLRTNLAALGVEDHVAEMCLGHGRTGLQRVYDQHKYLDQIRLAFERWAARLRDIVEPASAPTPEPGKVVAFAQGKRRGAR